jgi:hypothetical protein
VNERERRHNWAGVQLVMIAFLSLMSIYEVSQGEWRWIGHNLLAIVFLAVLIIRNLRAGNLP